MFYYVYLLGPVIDKIADQIRPACILFIRKAFSDFKKITADLYEDSNSKRGGTVSTVNVTTV
jgi:hypothetical protein